MLGVTSETERRKQTEDFVAKHGMEYPYAYDPDGKLQRAFDVMGIPSAALIDPTGRVLWRGHPASLNEGLIERSLAGAWSRPLWELPDEASAVRDAVRGDRYAAALKAAQELGGELGTALAADLERTIQARMKAIDDARADQDWGVAHDLAQRAASSFEGRPEGQRARGWLEEMEGSAAIRAVVEAESRLREIRMKLTSMKSKDEATALAQELRGIEKAQAGKPVAGRAAKIAETIEQALKRAR